MRTLSVCIVLSAIATIFTAQPASAQIQARARLQLSLVAQAPSRPEIVVEGAAGRYDRVASSDVTIPLALAAAFNADAGNFSMLASELFLKAEGAGNGTRNVETLGSAHPVKSISEQRVLSVPISAQGPVAQYAISACNGVAPSERLAGRASRMTMSLPLIWRVTTGRFNFKWTNYDRVAPSAEIINNRDFYAERETSEAEATVDATVVCAPLSSAKVVAAANGSPAKHMVFKPAPVAEKVFQDPPKQKTAVASSATTVAVIDTGKPRCDGGMVRQVSLPEVSYICLCPGNTQRVATGEDAFTCARRSRR